MIDKIIDSLLENKLADLTQYLIDGGYNENPGLARALRKLADTVDVASDVVDADCEETDHPGPDVYPSPPSWNVGDIE